MPKTVSIVMPKSWYDELKKIALEKNIKVSKIICDTLKRKFKFKEERRPVGQPKKYLKIKIQDIKQ